MLEPTGARLLAGRYALFPSPRQGGMAEIYKASDLKTDGQIVAVKIFRSEILNERLAREAFHRETEAIRSCVHPNIVRLLDAGTDGETGREFLVLEWIGQNLDQFRQKQGFRDWDEFYELIGRPILDALTLAHARQIVHRDVKPSNILIDETSVPKLADFSIAKFKRWREQGATLRDFASRPFAAPEPESQSTYSGDTFSFAVVALHCLSNQTITEYEDIPLALAANSLPDGVKEILRSCVGEPEERPVLAGILLSALDSAQTERKRRDRLRIPIHLFVTGRARENVRLEFLLERQEVENFILNDLAEMPALSQSGSKSLELFGGRCMYRLAMPLSAKDHLVIEDAHRALASTLDYRREKALPLHADFRIGKPLRTQEAATNLLGLLSNLETHEVQRRLSEARARENQLFNVWTSILQAKAQIERDRQPALPYSAAKLEGTHAVFTLTKAAPEGLLGQSRQVRRANKLWLTGEVESISGDQLTLRIEERYASSLPPIGDLTYDLKLARAAIDRQWAALDAVRYQRCDRVDLRDLIVFPSQSESPAQAGRTIRFFQESLAHDKRQAVIAALGAPDFLVVEGPPGTGKTTFITELILQVIADNPSARILLTSQTHVALDHVIGALQKLQQPVSAIRIGRIGDRRISPVAEALLLENRIETWRDDALKAGREFLAERCKKLAFPMSNLDQAILALRLIAARKSASEFQKNIKELEEALSSISSSQALTDPDERRAIAEAARSLRDEIVRVEAEAAAADRMIVSVEAQLTKGCPFSPVDASNEDLEEYISKLFPEGAAYVQLKNLADIHADWQLRCGRTPDFQAAVLSSVQLVAGTCLGIDSSRGIQEVAFDLCIVDEASKATSTELLVPLSKAKRWVLVGDDRQLPPFIDVALEKPEIMSQYELTAEELRTTLFGQLKAGLPESCHIELRTQHRMTPAIGDLISECFYDGKLTSVQREWDSTLSAVLPKAVTWLTTARMEHRTELRSGESYMNQREIRVIESLLRRLAEACQAANTRYHVAILTPYGAQKQALERALARSLSGDSRLKIECNTVDAFQGQEVDVGIFSVTRSNPKRKLGFVDDFRRLNVALSRAREYLVIVGDHYFCRTASDPNPIRPVLSHIEAHAQSCCVIDASV